MRNSAIAVAEARSSGSQCSAAASDQEMAQLSRTQTLRALTPDEARAITNIACRLALILLLDASPHANYQVTKTAAYSWPVTKRTSRLREVLSSR